MKILPAFVLACFAFSSAFLPPCALAEPSPADRKFMTDAAADGLAEVELGRLASEKAEDGDVKQFGRMMVDDHTKANAELKALAKSKDVTLPADPKPHHEALMARLSRLSGEAFDRAYMSAMVKDHEKAVRMFTRESTAGGDADVRGWAGEKVPALRQHLEQSRELASKARRMTDAGVDAH